MANLRDLIPFLKTGAVSGTWDASAVTVITNSVASEFLAATMVTNSESSYDLVPDATAIYNAPLNLYFSEAADPVPVLKSGITWSRITAPSIDAGDNTLSFAFGIKNTGETGADAIAKTVGATPVAAGDFEALLLLDWRSAQSNFSFSLYYVNNGVAGQAALPAVTSGQTVYFGIDWATGILYYQIDAGAVTTTGVTLSAGFEALDWNTVINTFSNANPVVFLAGSVNFDLSDETGTHTPFKSSVSNPADYPPSPANKMYEVSGAGTVDNTALSVGDIVVFDADGLSFTRLNDATHITSSTLSNESGVPGPTVKDALDSLNLTNAADAVIFDSGVAESNGSIYKTWLEAYNAVINSLYKKRIIIIDRDGVGVTIPSSVGATASDNWQMEGLIVEGLNIDTGRRAEVILADNCRFNLNPANTVDGSGVYGKFRNCSIRCNSSTTANFTKTANSGSAGWEFENIILNALSTAPAFSSDVANTGISIVLRGVNTFIASTGATLFQVNGDPMEILVYGTFTTALIDKTTAILGSAGITIYLYTDSDIDLFYDEDWTAYTGYTGTVQIRSQLSVKSLVLDSDIEYAYPAIKHANGQVGTPLTVSGTVSINHKTSQDFTVNGASTITFNTDVVNAQIGAELRFFVTTADAVSFAAGTATVNTKAAGLNAQGQYSVIHAKRTSPNTWILWGDLGV